MRNLCAALAVAGSVALCMALIAQALAMATGFSIGMTGGLGVAGAAAFFVSLWPAMRIGPALIARYDQQALRVALQAGGGIHRAAPLGEPLAAAWDDLQRWCFAGAGPGTAPWWHPTALPQIGQRFSVAVLAGADHSHFIEAFSRHLDGADRLAAAGSSLGRWQLRLSTKLHDCLWWRERQPTDAWDCGYLVDDAQVRQSLAHFQPRRATLLVAQGLPVDALRACIAVLEPRRADFRQPVRLLIVGNTAHDVLGPITTIQGG